MSANLATKSRSFFESLIAIVGESSWVMFSFFFVAGIIFAGLIALIPSLSGIENSTLGQLIVGAIIYAVVLLVVILPVRLRRGKVYLRRILGISKRPTNEIVWLPFVMWVAYMAATIVVAIGINYVPWIDSNQAQDVGFNNVNLPYEYVLAFFALVIIPPIAEELLFRGYLFGRLRERFTFWPTAIIVSVVFGIVHMQWNVGIDVAVLSLFLCYLRERTGSIWASMVLHATKNGLAYILLFIAPLIR